MSTLKRILLVEDSDNDVQLTLAALEETHLANEVDVVKDGQQALDYLFRRGAFTARGEEHPAVVLLDLKLPKLNGLEVLARLKGDPELKTIPVVMLTSSREEPDLKRAYGLGVNAYVVKPVGFNAFTSALKELGLFWAILNEPPPGTVRKDSH
jgi:CheY-like chemotaxis protein